MAISFVGGKTFQDGGAASAQSVSLTDLTGGSNTSPSANDVVVVAYSIAALSQIPPDVTGYTAGSPVAWVDEGWDTNFGTFYKVMGGSPDTTLTINSSGAFDNGRAVAILVFRGVDTATPLDTTSTTLTGINGCLADPPAITPVTAGAWIVAAGATGSNSSIITYAASGLSQFRTVCGGASSNFATVGAGYYSSWTSGAYNPAAFTLATGATTNNYGRAAATLALRPALEPSIGDAAITDAADTASSAGVLRIAGAAAITDAADTVSSAGVLRIAGVANITDTSTPDVLLQTSQYIVVGAYGGASDDDTVYATGVSVQGTIAEASIADAEDTVVATGWSSVVDATDTISATGASSITGAASITDEADIISAVGLLPVLDGNDLLTCSGTLDPNYLDAIRARAIQVYSPARRGSFVVPSKWSTINPGRGLSVQR